MPPLSGWTVWITGFVGKVSALDQVMHLFVNDFFIPITIFLIMLALWLGQGDPVRREHLQRGIMSAAVAIGISSLIVKIMNIHIFWPHPYAIPDKLFDSARYAMQTIHYPSGDPTFPSNAATISFAAAIGVYLTNRKAGIVIYFLAFLWSFAHFYAGMHFFVDIIAGAAIGILTAIFISKVFMPRIEPIPTLVMKLWRYLYLA